MDGPKWRSLFYMCAQIQNKIVFFSEWYELLKNHINNSHEKVQNQSFTKLFSKRISFLDLSWYATREILNS